MGLITKEVEVSLSTNSIRYYRNLGYIIPQSEKPWGVTTTRGTKLMVKVIDLPKSSLISVKIKCDKCNEILELPYRNYVQCNHNGKYYCHKCACDTFNSKENNYRWNKDMSDNERENKRCLQEYKDFVKRVMARDNYTCVVSGKTSKETELEVHHLDGYNWCINKRLDVTNAITVTKDLHRAFHAKYGSGNNTKEQFLEFIEMTNILSNDYNEKIPMAKMVYDIEENKVYNSAIEYSRTHKVQQTEIYACCNHKTRKIKYVKNNGEISYYDAIINHVLGHHLLWYDEYIQMSDNDVERFLQQSRNKNCIKVICITTGAVFDSAADAARHYKIQRGCIGNCCKGKQKTAGRLNGVPLKWMYYDKLIELSNEEQDKLLVQY